MDVVILGSGTSHGVPMIACDCAVCLSDDPRNKRSRCSALLSWEGRNVLVDTSLDFRMQMLAHRVQRVDAILYTHTHADHLHGLDDVRRFNAVQGGPIPAYGSPTTVREIERQYAYVFTENDSGSSKPSIVLEEVRGPFELFGKRIEPVQVWHGPWEVLAYRVDDFAYVCDASRIEREEMEKLRGLSCLVIDGLRERPHPTHFNIAGALAVIEELAPTRAYLTHITHDLDHEETNRRLPPGVELAYDGLAITV